jgi:hypothetical protein
MKRIGLLLIVLTIAVFANGQIVKIQGGTSISKLDWQFKGINVDSPWDETLIGYSIFAGIDYLDKSYFNLSSNIGMIRKGGQGAIPLMDYGGKLILNYTDKPTLDYLSLNTTIDFKYQIREAITPFIGFGPRFDYLLNNSRHFDELKKLGEFNDISFGLILGGGLKYDISDFQFGFRVDYYFDFKNCKTIAEWTIEETGMGGKVSVNTFMLNLSIGYRLK